jgi:hypothetical protein
MWSKPILTQSSNSIVPGSSTLLGMSSTNELYYCCSFLKRHQIFQVEYRGSLEVLKLAVTLEVHTANILLKKELRYDPLGPWPHGPEP